MPLAFRTEHLKRYADLARLLVKYGRSDLVKQIGLDKALAEGEAESEEALAQHRELATELAADLERLGPTFVKLGQLLSTRVDLLPPSYLDALSRLQDRLRPVPYEQVREILTFELDEPLEDVFREIEEAPLASASLGQVHRAQLKDGRIVAVKVQRPGVRRTILDDFEVLEQIAVLMDRHTELGRHVGFEIQLYEMRRTLLAELDYRREASHLASVGRKLDEFEQIVVPRPIDELTTERVLTMEYVSGTKIGDLTDARRGRIDGKGLAQELFSAYLKQVLIDGMFHADPHPGNLVVLDDGRLALLDLGMVGFLSPGIRLSLLKLLLAISEGDGDRVATLAIAMSTPRDDMDETLFRRRVAEMVIRFQETDINRLEIGRLLFEISRTAMQSGLRAPTELTLLGRTLLHLDQIGRYLDPDFNPNEAVRRHVGHVVRNRMLGLASPGQIVSSLLDAEEFLGSLPRQVHRALDLIAGNKLKLHVDAINELELIRGFEKIANRITAGAVLAGLTIGAALLMQVETTFTILGYPGFAMICFLLAAGCGFWLVWNILWQDRHRR
jgi:predicted unusual protein kinase regulating ubiquinone biosynthesis (AarF/ABC1/UbiB family)